MGIYFGQRENPCPRCGGVVATTFISVSPMTFSQTCGWCGAHTYTPEEEAALGANRSPLVSELVTSEIWIDAAGSK